MQFKLFMENEKNILDELNKFIQNKPKLARPTTILEVSSNDSYIFNTTNPDIVIRVAPEERSECEHTLAEEEIQETGGVVKIYYIADILLENHQHTVTWKEKVDTNVEGFLLRNHKDKYEEVGWVLAALYHVNREGMNILSRFPPTKRLAAAIMHGLPVKDLALESNLGVNKQGFIVAYDC